MDATPPAPTTAPSALEEGIIFALNKFLEHARVLEQEEGILRGEVVQLDTNLKTQKVKRYIAKLKTYG